MSQKKTKKMYYKYCIVPECTSTTTATPKKLFFCVPRNPEIRTKWCNAMKRKDKLSFKAGCYCCEDHFDVENDMRSYIKHKLAGGPLILKGGVLPHKFDCQNPNHKTSEKLRCRKRKPVKYVDSNVNKNDLACDNLTIDGIDNKNDDNSEDIEPKEVTNDKNITMNKSGSTSKCKTNATTHNNTMNCNQSCTDSDSTSAIDSCNIEDSYVSSNAGIEKETETKLFNEHMLKGSLMSMSREPQLFTGIPKQPYQACIKHLCQFTGIPVSEVLISLRKIRRHEPNSIISIYFGLSEISVSRCFINSIPKIGKCMKELVFMPLSDDIRLNVPITLRKRYSTVTSIIDCFEVNIEKPKNSEHQEHTRSQYGNCYTMKYLISITPYGLINFISDGYGGRTSDSFIFEHSGFLEQLTEGSEILVDKGFENISYLLEQRGCTLLRPPSISSKCKPTKAEDNKTRQYAGLSLLANRVVGRLRDFEMIGRHACVDISCVDLLNYILTTACGIVNLQDCLIDYHF